jgi:hypothetical protein
MPSSHLSCLLEIAALGVGAQARLDGSLSSPRTDTHAKREIGGRRRWDSAMVLRPTRCATPVQSTAYEPAQSCRVRARMTDAAHQQRAAANDPRLPVIEATVYLVYGGVLCARALFGQVVRKAQKAGSAARASRAMIFAFRRPL